MTQASKFDFLAEWQRLIEKERIASINYEQAVADMKAENGCEVGIQASKVAECLSQLAEVKIEIADIVTQGQALRDARRENLLVGYIDTKPLFLRPKIMVSALN